MSDIKAQRPPRIIAHELCSSGCPGFRSKSHTDECNRLTDAIMRYGIWRERKAIAAEREACAELAATYVGWCTPWEGSGVDSEGIAAINTAVGEIAQAIRKRGVDGNGLTNGTGNRKRGVS